MIRRRRATAVLVSVSLLAACGSSEDTAGSNTLPEVSTAGTGTATEPEATAAPSSTTANDPTVVVTTLDPPRTTTLATMPEGGEILPVPAPPPDADAGPVPLCQDLPIFATDLVGDGSQIDENFFRLVSLYGAANPDVFGGVWIDRDAGGVAVIGFTDDPESHRAALAALTVEDLPDADVAAEFGPEGPLGDRDFPWDLVQVEFTEVMLAGLVGTVFEQGQRSPVAVVSAASSITIQRVSLDLAEPTAEALVELAAHVDANIVCVNGPLLDPNRVVFEPGDEIDVILPPGDGAYPPGLRVGCANSATYPLENVLDPTFLVDAGRDDLLDGIQQAGDIGIEDPSQFAPIDTWVLLEETDDTAIVYSPRGFALRQLDLQLTAAGWVFSGSSSGGDDCELLTQLPDGLGAVEWVADPATPLNATANTVTVLATEQSCAGSRDPGDQLLGPQVVETDTEVLISFAVIPLAGPQTCPGNPSTSVAIELDQPLGDRTLREGRSTGLTLDELLTR